MTQFADLFIYDAGGNAVGLQNSREPETSCKAGWYDDAPHEKGYYPQEAPSKAIDGDSTTKFLCATSPAVSLTVFFPASTVGSYT